MTKYCRCGYTRVHKRGTRNWLCDNPECPIWSLKYARNGNLIKVTRVAVPREHPLTYDIIGEMSK